MPGAGGGVRALGRLSPVSAIAPKCSMQLLQRRPQHVHREGAHGATRRVVAAPKPVDPREPIRALELPVRCRLLG